MPCTLQPGIPSGKCAARFHVQWELPTVTLPKRSAPWEQQLPAAAVSSTGQAQRYRGRLWLSSWWRAKPVVQISRLICRCAIMEWFRSVVSDSLRPHGQWPTRLRGPWDFPGKNTGVGCHFLLPGIFPTQGSNPGLLHCRHMFYCLSH